MMIFICEYNTTNFTKEKVILSITIEGKLIDKLFCIFTYV